MKYFLILIFNVNAVRALRIASGRLFQIFAPLTVMNLKLWFERTKGTTNGSWPRRLYGPWTRDSNTTGEGIILLIDLNTNKRVFKLHISLNFNSFSLKNRGIVCSLLFLRIIKRISFFWVVMMDWKWEGDAEDHTILQ